MIELLGRMGVERHRRRAHAHRGRPAHDRASTFAPYELVKTMRASILVLGPLVARYGSADVSLPGGCAIGARPVNIHVAGLQAMGADIHIENGYIKARAGRLQGRAPGARDRHRHRHREPDDGRRAGRRRRPCSRTPRASPRSSTSRNFLNAMGAKITGAGTDTIVDRRRRAPARHAATTCCPTASRPAPTWWPARSPAAASARKNARPEHLDAVLGKLAGGRRRRDRAATTGSRWTCAAGGRSAVDIRTAPYPAFPTDMQAQFAALEHRGRRRRHDRRDDLREPLHAHARDAAHGRGDPARGQYRDHQGRAEADRRAGDGHRPARLGEPGARRAGRRGHAPRSSASTTSTAATSASRRSCSSSARRSGAWAGRKVSGQRPGVKARGKTAADQDSWLVASGQA